MDTTRDGASVPLPESRRLPRPKLAIVALLALILLTSLSESLYRLPLNRVIEKRLCREYYRSHDPSIIHNGGAIDEKYCKLDAIQQSLAWYVGIMETLWIVGGKSSSVEV